MVPDKADEDETNGADGHKLETYDAVLKIKGLTLCHDLVYPSSQHLSREYNTDAALSTP